MNKRNLLMLVLCWLLPAGLAAQISIQNISYTSAQPVHVSATAAITAGPAVVVATGANVTYTSATSVRLLPGFRTEGTGYFHAVIGTPPSGPYALTVVNGSGSATGLATGRALSITANAAPANQYFAGWTLDSGTGVFGSYSLGSTFFLMGAGSATIRATYSSTPPAADSDGDGVSDAVETALGLNPNDASDVNVQRYQYDRINQLKRGPGGEYIKDAEGNIEDVVP